MIDQQVIEEQAKRIMDDFLKELKEIGQEERFGLEREDEMRTPKPLEPNAQFRRAFLENAPKVRDNEIVAERKQW